MEPGYAVLSQSTEKAAIEGLSFDGLAPKTEGDWQQKKGKIGSFTMALINIKSLEENFRAKVTSLNAN